MKGGQFLSRIVRQWSARLARESLQKVVDQLAQIFEGLTAREEKQSE
jgi:hypothetical protein